MAAVTKVGINHCYLTVTGTVISMGVAMLSELLMYDFVEFLHEFRVLGFVIFICFTTLCYHCLFCNKHIELEL